MSRLEPDILITDLPLTTRPASFSSQAGGVVEFFGVVRGHEGEAEITGIHYECHQAMAHHQLAKVAAETCERFPVLGLTVQHRIGFVPVAEPSLFLRVSAAHRGPAFAAAEWLIVQLKLRVPIWKHPVNLQRGAAAGEAHALR